MFKWQEEYVSGNETIDEQHYNLFELARDVVRLLEEETISDTDALYETFERLVQYSIYHFATEEEFWLKHDETLYKQQKDAHRHFVKWLNDLNLDLIEDNSRQFLLSIFNELSAWFKNHVLVEMKQIIALSRAE